MENEDIEYKETVETAEKNPGKRAAFEAKFDTVNRKLEDIESKTKKIKGKSIIHKVIFTLIAVILFISVCAICDKIKMCGLDISIIRSVGGKTLEEAYYESVGEMYMHLADFIKVLAGGISAIILCITYK